MAYLKNAWYIAAWSDEVAKGAMLARTLLDVPVVLVRRADGQVGALLSRGQVTELGVQCGYHGLRFDLKGGCVGNPHGPAAAAIRVSNFTVLEAYNAIWIWMGSAAADPKLLPDLSYIDATPATAFSKGYLHSKGHYELYTDNMHPSTIGSGAITRTKPQIEERSHGVSIQWLALNEQLGPLMESMLKLDGAPADVWTEVHWHAPDEPARKGSTIGTYTW